MTNNNKNKWYFSIFKHLAQWVAWAILLSGMVGTLVALFLWLLDAATHFRWQHPWLLWLLPLAGIAIYFIYKIAGKNVGAGNNLILDEIHEPGAGVPGRMAPLVLAATIITHLFGGSAGREGTAVQIGGSVAGKLAQWLKIPPSDKRTLLMMGIAAGFGAVFGTPVAGAVFAIEVLAIGQLAYKALLPCLLASYMADRVCSQWGIHHTAYFVTGGQTANGGFPTLHFDVLLFIKVAVAGIAFGWCSRLFVAATHSIKEKMTIAIPRHQWLIPAIGGIVIIALSLLPGNTDYLGLGVNSAQTGGVSIVGAFDTGGAHTFSWLWKLAFTAITLGTGFKGGEVTPLFFMGATLGNVLAGYMGAPTDLLAGLGFIAVFAGAANTPLACMLMGAELFGTQHLLYYAAACVAAYYCSGHKGIYSAQRVHRHKWGRSPNHKK